MFNRRRRMLTLLALGNSLKAIVDALSEEFHCSKQTIYRDYERMSTWIHAIQQDEKLSAMVYSRLEYLNREAIDLMQGIENKSATARDKFIKIGAMNTCLKITAEQIKLGQELGIIERKPVEVITNALSSMPFVINPDVKRALDESAAEQREQKRLMDEKRLKDASESNQAQANARG